MYSDISLHLNFNQVLIEPSINIIVNILNYLGFFLVLDYLLCLLLSITLVLFKKPFVIDNLLSYFH